MFKLYLVHVSYHSNSPHPYLLERQAIGLIDRHVRSFIEDGFTVRGNIETGYTFTHKYTVNYGFVGQLSLEILTFSTKSERNAIYKLLS